AFVVMTMQPISHGQQPRDSYSVPRRLPVGPLVEGSELVVAAPAAHTEGSGNSQSALTETVGLLSGLYLYQTYLNIGLLADGKSERLYEEKAARAVLASVVKPLDAVDQQLATVGTLAATETDRHAANRLRGAVALLRRQGTELTAFWDTRDPAAGARYEATR